MVEESALAPVSKPPGSILIDGSPVGPLLDTALQVGPSFLALGLVFAMLAARSGAEARSILVAGGEFGSLVLLGLDVVLVKVVA